MIRKAVDTLTRTHFRNGFWKVAAFASIARRFVRHRLQVGVIAVVAPENLLACKRRAGQDLRGGASAEPHRRLEAVDELPPEEAGREGPAPGRAGLPGSINGLAHQHAVHAICGREVLETLRHAPALAALRLPVELCVAQVGDERVGAAIGVLELFDDALHVVWKRFYDCHRMIIATSGVELEVRTEEIRDGCRPPRRRRWPLVARAHP